VSENKKEVALITYADFTMKDLETIEKFKEGGLLGLAQLSDIDVEKAMALYLDGKTYRQVASVLKINKSTILYLADRFKWFELRQEYLEELSSTLPQKIIESKLQSQEFFLHLITAYQKKIGKNIDKYLKTNDEQWADKVDTKDLSAIIKITELLYKLSNESIGNPNDKSMVSLNGLSEGVTITKTGQNSIEISPTKSQFSNKLKMFADLKRAQEKENQPDAKPSHDITNETLTQKDQKNEETK
jgi:hypothetical protein